MPSVSKKQHNAMEAAAHGKSTLDIPKSVGQEFLAADKGRKFAGGGPITAASIEAGGTPNQGPKGVGVGMPAISSLPKTVDPISTTNTPPGGGASVASSTPSPGGFSESTFNPSNGYVGGGGAQGPWGVALADGGMVPNTMGASYSFPPPPGQRKQGPRNYSKKG